MTETAPEGGANPDQPDNTTAPPPLPQATQPQQPKAGEGDRAVASNLEPTDPSEEFATAARDERVEELVTLHEENGDTEAAAKVREQLTQDPNL